MHRFSRWVAALLTVGALTLPFPAAGQAVRVPGTEVRLTPPDGFEPSNQFPGFQNAELGASIMITEIPGPASKVKLGMNRKGLASRGMALLESSEVMVGDDTALLLHISQASGGEHYFKWMLVGGTEERAVLVVGTFPDDASELSEPIRASVLSTTWDASRPARTDRFEGLNFRVDATPRLRFAERMGNLLILTENGKLATGNPRMAVLIVGGSVGEVRIDDLARFAQERLLKTDRLKKVQVQSDSAVRIDNLPGREILAEGRDAKDGRAVGVYQLLLADGKSYFIAQGFVVRARLKEVLPAFRRVTGSFRRVEEKRPQITQ